MEKNQIKTDRYTSFEGINCIQNAIDVLDHTVETLKDPKINNAFWEKFIKNLPESYYNKNTEDEDLLYIVCSNVYYLEELFDLAENQKGLDALDKCEYECC